MTVAPGSTTGPGRGVLTLLRRHWSAVVLALVAAVFIAQNRDTVSFDVLTLNVRAPLWLVLSLVFLVGTAFGWLLVRRRTRRSQR